MAKQDISLDIPSDEGRVIYGAVVSTAEFQATVRPPLFRTVVPDPSRLESRGLDTHHPELVQVAEMRRKVQRLIERAKKSNVPDYAAYIYEKAKAGEGFTPQVVLWSPQPLRTVIDESTGLGAIVIPDEARLIAIDGDTQATARHEARRLYTDMPDHERIKIVILHGIGVEAAQQVFHDANARGVKVSTSLAIGFDNRDPVTRLSRRSRRRPRSCVIASITRSGSSARATTTSSPLRPCGRRSPVSSRASMACRSRPTGSSSRPSARRS